MKKIKNKKVPNNLRKYRMARGFKQKDVALILGLNSTSMISRWENGNCLPNSMNILRLAVLYRVLVDALFSDLQRLLKNELVKSEEEFINTKEKKVI